MLGLLKKVKEKECAREQQKWGKAVQVLEEVG